METHTALDALGLHGSPSWSEIRRAHREAIRHAHPDAGGDPVRAAVVNQAFDALVAATGGGTRPLPQPAVKVARSTAPPPRMAGPDDPTEVLLLLADAAHDIGEVVFVDPDAGLMEVVVGDAPAVGQLAIQVRERSEAGDGVAVAFTLDALGVTPAPPIQQVVGDLMARYRHRAAPNQR